MFESIITGAFSSTGFYLVMLFIDCARFIAVGGLARAIHYFLYFIRQ